MASRCDTNYSNIGGSLVCKANLSDVVKILAVKGTYTMTLVNALLEATWTAARKAAVGSRLYPFATAYNSEPANIEQEYKQAPFKGTVAGKRGFEGVTLTIEGLTPQQIAKYQSFNNKNTKAYLVDTNKNIRGWSDGTNFKPFDVMLHVEDMRIADNMGVVKVRIEIMNPEQWNTDGYIVEPTWDVLALEGVNDVTLTVASPLTSGASVTVTDTLSGNPIEGLVSADFVVKKGTGAVSATSVEGDSGVYALTFTTTSGAHTVNLAAASAISLTDIAVEATATAFTV